MAARFPMTALAQAPAMAEQMLQPAQYNTGSRAATTGEKTRPWEDRSILSRANASKEPTCTSTLVPSEARIQVLGEGKAHT